MAGSVIYKSLFFVLSSALTVNLLAQPKDGWNLSPVDVLNTAGDEYAPRVSEQGLLYSRSPEAGELNVELRTELMFSSFRKNGLSQGRRFSAELSSPLHESTACFGPNEDFLVFSRNALSKKKATNFLYLSKNGVLDYQEAEELPFNDTRYNCTHPSLDASGKRLLFASDRPGGFGGFDLYYAEYRNGAWSAPINLGPDINSKSDEIFPSWNENQIITFSSNRLGGFGGLDLYVFDASQTTWTHVEHLGKPFSSEGDDHGLSWSIAKGQGFLSSNRVGGKGGDDIYSFSFSKEFPISWLSPKRSKDRLVLLNREGEVFASLNEFNMWKGDLIIFPEVMENDHRATAKRLCGNFSAGSGHAPDTVRMQGVKVEIERVGMAQPIFKAILRNLNDGESSTVYQSDYTGGVCIPYTAGKQSWRIEKEGFESQSIVLDPSIPYSKGKLAMSSAEDTVVLQHTIVANRSISNTILDKLVSATSEMALEPSYQLIGMQLNLLSTQTPPMVRKEANRLAESIRKEMLIPPSIQVNAEGQCVFTDEGQRERDRIDISAEAVLEFEMVYRRVPPEKELGLTID